MGSNETGGSATDTAGHHAHVEITQDGLTIDDVIEVARGFAPVTLNTRVEAALERNRAVVERLITKEQPIYGITTGFGRFSDVFIPAGRREVLQEKLLQSHAAGVGPVLPTDATRAAILLRANSLARGYSGVRPAVIHSLLDLLNARVHPVIPEQGSLGASGDLAPLAHMALVLLGQGRAEYNGAVMDGAEALRLAGLAPLTLEAKEGLALINGTQIMTAVGVLAWYDALRLLDRANTVAALSFEALQGIPAAFDRRIAALRPHPGHLRAAAALRAATKDSRLTTRPGELRVQDAYSLRCLPQVHGAAYDALAYIESMLEREINSVTDNPLVFADPDEIVSGGNFHGQPIAQVMDLLAIAMTDVGAMAERRIERLLNPQYNGGLPPFLALDGGLNSGFMLAQYTAASLVAENRVLAHPASVDSIPSSAGQEDHVSMGTIAARKARQVVENTAMVFAIELCVAAQAADLRVAQKLGIDPGRSGPAPDEVESYLGEGSRQVYRAVRAVVPFMPEDRLLGPDLATARQVLMDDATRP